MKILWKYEVGYRLARFVRPRQNNMQCFLVCSCVLHVHECRHFERELLPNEAKDWCSPQALVHRCVIRTSKKLRKCCLQIVIVTVTEWSLSNLFYQIHFRNVASLLCPSENWYYSAEIWLDAVLLGSSTWTVKKNFQQSPKSNMFISFHIKIQKGSKIQ